MGHAPPGRYHCDKCQQGGPTLTIYGTEEGDRVLCAPCKKIVREEEREKRNCRPHGVEHRIPISPAELARRLEKMHVGQKAWLERRKELRARNLLENGEVVPGKINNRWWQVLIMHCSGYDAGDIARIMGYKNKSIVNGILRHRDMMRWIGEVKKAQLERVLTGQFGVRAQAKAAAPKVMEQMVSNAMRADKPSDQIKAGQTVLQVAGEMVQRHEHNHIHAMLKDLTDAELVNLRDRAIWPDRYKQMAEKLGLVGNGQPLLPAPED